MDAWPIEAYARIGTFRCGLTRSRRTVRALTHGPLRVDPLGLVRIEMDRPVVLGEQRGDELAAAGDADLVADGLDVVAHRMRGQVQLGGDLRRAGAAGDELRDLLLARRELVGLDDDRGDLRRLGVLDDERGVAQRAVRVAQARRMADEPAARRARPQPR